MANFNFIINAVNASANPIGTFTAPTGTRMLFNQASPPFGWTQETGAAYNDTSVRTVTGAGGASGGTTSWSGWNFNGTYSLNPFTITTAQLPLHTHGVSLTSNTSNQSLNQSAMIEAIRSGGGDFQLSICDCRLPTAQSPLPAQASGAVSK